ncbi:dehydratase [Flavobacterium beibuense F44-8]|uniref:Dehydratase n=1 Tax=Flavobacterium beibuense F44-8 TaxID=1406840 RepID=A0A0A2LYK9_9FLAO|nr:NAD-dependent epimerase/dehydratase family protein [Flavobacterium beibuense]KGO84293.1 dehydratase [Flavobacterium beibuense F44-8]
MKLIITGASGFVGQNFLGYLKGKEVDVQELSLRDISWENKIDLKANAIVHLAGKAHDTRKNVDVNEYFEINLDLTIKLFDEFLKSDIKDFFFFSSVKAVADCVDSVLLESTLPNPQTPYGISKLKAEQYLLSQKLPSDKRLFIVRPCMIHGPQNKGNLNLLYKIVEKGVPWFLAAFKNERSFLSVDNLNFLLYEMMIDKNLVSGVYNFSDDQSLSTNQLIEIISDTLGKRSKLWNIPMWIVKNVVKFGDLIPFIPLNSERLKKITGSYVVSNEKIKQSLGIKQLPLTAERGLVMTIKSFKNNK